MTTSYELSLRLKELGVDQEGGEYYYYDVKGQEILLHSLSFMAASFNAICRAFTLGELVRELPINAFVCPVQRMSSRKYKALFKDGGLVSAKVHDADTPEESAGELLAELKQKEG